MVIYNKDELESIIAIPYRAFIAGDFVDGLSDIRHIDTFKIG
jgi:hypothetical protein